MVGRYKHVFPLVLNKHVFPLVLIAAVATVTGQDAVNSSLQAQPSPTIICRYDPNTGAPNPLGMRAFITLTEADGSTEVVYEQLGSFVPGPVEAVVTSERSLTFPQRSIDAVRQLLLNTPNYYRELLGSHDPEGFAPVNDTLVCRADAVAARPVARPSAAAELPNLGTSAPNSGQPGAPGPRADLPDLGGVPGGAPAGDTSADSAATPTTFYGTVAGLADGNYRYVSGPADDRVYSDQELLNRGGVLFVFRKTGDDIMGSYSYIDGEAICVMGRVSGNTVSGQAYPADGVVQDLAEEFAPWGPAAFLRVRRTRDDGEKQYYGGATLELSDFSRINAGSALPPSSCE